MDIIQFYNNKNVPERFPHNSIKIQTRNTSHYQGNGEWWEDNQYKIYIPSHQRIFQKWKLLNYHQFHLDFSQWTFFSIANSSYPSSTPTEFSSWFNPYFFFSFSWSVRNEGILFSLNVKQTSLCLEYTPTDNGTSSKKRNLKYLFSYIYKYD